MQLACERIEDSWDFETFDGSPNIPSFVLSCDVTRNNCCMHLQATRQRGERLTGTLFLKTEPPATTRELSRISMPYFAFGEQLERQN